MLLLRAKSMISLIHYPKIYTQPLLQRRGILTYQLKPFKEDKWDKPLVKQITHQQSLFKSPRIGNLQVYWPIRLIKNVSKAPNRWKKCKLSLIFWWFKLCSWSILDLLISQLLPKIFQMQAKTTSCWMEKRV